MHKTLHCCLKPLIQLNCPKKNQPIYWLVTSFPIIDQNPAAVDHCQAELSKQRWLSASHSKRQVICSPTCTWMITQWNSNTSDQVLIFPSVTNTEFSLDAVRIRTVEAGTSCFDNSSHVTWESEIQFHPVNDRYIQKKELRLLPKGVEPMTFPSALSYRSHVVSKPCKSLCVNKQM